MKELISFFSQIFNSANYDSPLTKEEVEWHINNIEEERSLYPLY